MPKPPAHKITIGADPEFFVKLGRTFKSAHGLVAGTKAEPSPLKDGAVQVDGLALEFNIDPCDTAEKFDSCITSVLSQIRDIVPAKYSFEFVPTAKFTPLHMAKQPPEALELGCEPDYNAYLGEANDKPDGAAGLRTAAGHVHIGIDRVLSEVEKRKLVILCDIFLGLDSLSWDTDTLRRSMYGKAGCYRSKPYGIEYRTMSNAWVSDPKLRKRVFDGAVEAVNNLDNFNKIIELVERKTGSKYYEGLPNCINNSDPVSAERLLAEVYRLVYRQAA